MKTTITDMLIAWEMLSLCEGEHGQLVHRYVIDPETTMFLTWWCDGRQIDIGSIDRADLSLSLHEFSARYLQPAVDRLRNLGEQRGPMKLPGAGGSFWCEVSNRGNVGEHLD